MIGKSLARMLGVGARVEVLGDGGFEVKARYKGLIIGIIASHSKAKALEKATSRVREGVADLALALWIKDHVAHTAPRLGDGADGIRFDVKIVIQEGFEDAIRELMGVDGSDEAWINDVNMNGVKELIENAVMLLAGWNDLQRLVDEARRGIRGLVEDLILLDREETLKERLSRIMYKQNTHLTMDMDSWTIIGQAVLSILLSTILYENARLAGEDLQPLAEYTKRHGYIGGLKKAFKDVLERGEGIARLALEVLEALPSSADEKVGVLVDLGTRIAARSNPLRRDLAGRLYRELAGDITLKKGFATFYTETPAAYLLAYLAINHGLGLDETNIENMNQGDAVGLARRIARIRIADFACGSGILLTASYSILYRIAAVLKYYHGLDLDLEGLGRRLIEDGIYGVDALEYAVEIALANLSLISPRPTAKRNIYLMRLGAVPGQGGAWLGSLELLNEVNMQDTTNRVSEGMPELLDRFDIIIMNPPFTRATGRPKYIKGGLFGFIEDEDLKGVLHRSYNRLRRRIQRELLQIAVELGPELPEVLRGVVEGRATGLERLLDIGHAGKGLPFLHLAHKYVGEGGVIAFVLPRSILSGVSWFLARTLLASRFQVKYVIVSSDPRRGYSFSEGSSLSEALIIAKRVDNHRSDEDTIFINLLEKPETVLKALMLAEDIMEAVRENPSCCLGVDGKWIAYKAGRRRLLSNIDNWNRLTPMPDPSLVKVIHDLLGEGKIALGRVSIRIPMTRLGMITESIGVDRHQFHDNFKIVGGRTRYPILYGGGEELRTMMGVKPNAYATPKTPRGDALYNSFSGRILLPDRIRWNTSHALVLHSNTQLLSNIFYTARLKASNIIWEAEKALVLWLNSTWGLLTILASRGETEGPWSSLKITHWRLLPALDLNALDKNQIVAMARVFDELAGKPLRRIPEQFKPGDPDPVRTSIDMGVINVLDPDMALRRAEVLGGLKSLYKHVYNALEAWVGK